MKSIYLTPVAYAALLFGCAIANAQSAATPPADRPDAAPMANHADTTKGNNLVGTTPADQVSTPASTGQDKSTGNNLVSPKGDADQGDMKQASAARPDFNTLDTKKKGTLSSDDVKSNKWLRTNFARCDSDHDGRKACPTLGHPQGSGLYDMAHSLLIDPRRRSMDGSGRRPPATVGHGPPQRLMILRFAPNRCPNAQEIVFEAVLDERAPVVLPVPFIDAEPLFERIG